MKPTFLAACISLFKTLKCHMPLDGVTSKSANNVLCLSLRDIIQISPHYVHKFRSLAVTTPPLQMKYSIL